MIFPTKRLKKLFHLIHGEGQEQAWTSQALADRLEVTVRTIRDDLKKLDHILTGHGGSLESKRGRGYSIRVHEAKLYDELLEERKDDRQKGAPVPGSPDERIRYELFKLLGEPGHIKMEDLADQLYISRATMNNDLKIIRQILENYQLQLQIKPGHGVKVVGDEQRFRYCLAEYADARDEELGPEGMTAAQERLLYPIEPAHIREIVIRHVGKQDVRIADVALKDLITHLAVMVLRIKQGHELERFEKVEANLQDQQLAQHIIQDLESLYSIHCPVGERDYLLLHIVSKKMTATDWNGLRSDPLYVAVQQMLGHIYDRYTYDLRDDDRLPNDLYAHLKPMITRLEHGMNMRNPLLGHIRKYYPLAYEITISAVKQLQTYVPHEINDSEIGYLALHIGAALERKYQIPHRKRKSVLLVCGSGYGTARILESRLRSLFAELEVSRVVSLREYEEMGSVPEDLVISTIRLRESKGKPSAVIAAIPSERDMATITHLVRTSDEQEEMTLLRYFDPALFMFRSDQPDKMTLMAEMSGALLEKGIVTEQFWPAVQEREKMASTALGRGMAIPHPMELSSTHTTVSVCLLEKPIPWDEENEVHAVFMLSICKEDYEQAMGIYDLFVELIRQEEQLESLRSCGSFDAFAQLVCETLSLKSTEVY
ncbi:BglG family transcription antiterminator [Paenibacillus amylolyticus]|uniref:DeoR/PRD/PTS regulatory domain-containing protein n=1 Tax=Paenibacillus amylolyticus TaxID=1451 RepID=A0A100VIK2_PAEAM|nr:BglG family transcription antiterminator [Paenibacillus amylolyticus]GAS80471.1 DeoR/PRD/PTS regulatory domain-containing protein [Paenibacillus amylolyticus]